MTIKGHSTQERRNAQTFATVQELGGRVGALDSLMHFLFNVNIVPRQVEVGSTVRMIVSAGHTARKGDFLHFNSGLNINYEYLVVNTDANNIYLADDLPNTPVPVVDTFTIRRAVVPNVDEDGNISVSVASLTATMVDAGVHIDLSSTPILFTAYTDVKTLTTNITQMQVVNQSGSIFRLRIDATDVGFIVPGQEVVMPFAQSAGSVIRLQAVGADATIGNLFLNFFNA